MKIINEQGMIERRAYVRESTANRRTGKTDADKGAEKAPTDAIVSLTDTSRDVQVAKAAVGALPDVRADKVDAIRQAIDDGRYMIDPEKIAERMIGESLDGYI